MSRQSKSYEEARGILEDLARAWPEAHPHEAIITARQYLCTHCQCCGRPIVGTARVNGDVLCRSCDGVQAAPPPVQTRMALDTQQVLQAIRDPEPAAAEESFEAACQRWPARVRTIVAGWWGSEAVQVLRVAMAAEQITLPIRAPEGLSQIQVRRAVLGDPKIGRILADAARASVSVRALAPILFGCTPGTVSDDIARAIDAFDATARPRRRH